MSSSDPNDRKHYVPSSSMTMAQPQISMPADPHGGLHTMQNVSQFPPRPDPYSFVFQQPQPPQPSHAHPPTLPPPSTSRKRRYSETEESPGMSGQPSSSTGQYMGSRPPNMEPPSPLTPKRKASRTNTPWSAAEEQKLKQMREAGHSWSEIAKSFPSRTEGSVKKHWYKDMHYAEFAENETAALLNAIKEYDANKWKWIGQKVGKPAKACEQYAKEHFSKMKT